MRDATDFHVLQCATKENRETDVKTLTTTESGQNILPKRKHHANN
jgi:hypothetical protein